MMNLIHVQVITERNLRAAIPLQRTHRVRAPQVWAPAHRTRQRLPRGGSRRDSQSADT